jgi:SLT domain-containing protein/phage-related protein
LAYNAGDIESKLDLDRSPFITGLKETLAAAEKWRKEANKALKAQADIDTKPFNRALTAMQASLAKTFGKTYTAKVRIDDTGQLPKLTELNKRLTALGQKNVRPKVTVEVDDKSLATLGNRIAQLGRDRKIKIGLNIADLQVEAAAVKVIIDEITRDREIFVDLRWSRARAELTKLGMMLNAVTHDRNVNINVNVDKSMLSQLKMLGDGIDNVSNLAEGGSSGGLNHYQSRLLMIGSAITVGLAPAQGLLATLLATIPFLAGGAAASLGVLQMGFDNFATAVSNPVTASEIKRKKEALEQLSPVARQVAAIFENELKPAFQGLQHAVQDKMFEGVGEQLRKLIPYLGQFKADLVGLAGSFNIVGTSILGVITQAGNLRIIHQFLQDFSAGVAALSPFFTNLTQIFLTMASVGAQTFGALVQQLNAFSGEFLQMINIATQTGVLQDAFRALAQVTGALLYVFTSLMRDGFTMMVALGPTLATLIRVIADTFSAMGPVLTQLSLTFMQLLIPALDIVKILFDRLGPPIIKILDVLGKALVDALNACMPLIDALAKVVGDMLLAAINAIVPILPTLVDAISKLAMALVPVVEQVGPLFVKFIEALAPLLPPLADTFLRLVEAFLPLLPLITQLAMMALPPLIDALRVLAQVMGPVMEIGGQLIAGLIGGIVDAIVWVKSSIQMVGAIIVDTFKAIFGISSPSTLFAQFGNWILQGLINGITAMIGTVLGIFSALWNGITTVFSVALGFIQSVLSTGLAFISNLWNIVWTGISSFFSNIWNAMQAAAVAILTAIIGFIAAQIAGFQALWNNVWNAISTFFSGIWNAIKLFAIQLWVALVAFWKSGLTDWQGFWTNIWNAISTFFSNIWNSIKAFAIQLWVSLYAYWVGALNAWNMFWTNIWNSIINFFITLWNNIYARAQYYWELLKAYWAFAIGVFKKFWEDTWNDIKSKFEGIFRGIIDIATRIWNTVKGIFRDGINAVIHGVNWPIDKINGLFGISIPRIPDIPPFAVGGYLDMAAMGTVPNAPIGPINGPGGPTDDRVLARLSNKEHVWSAAEVEGAGGHKGVAALRAMALQKAQPFASGGTPVLGGSNRPGARPDGGQIRPNFVPAIDRGSYVVPPDVASFATNFLNALSARQPEAIMAAGGKGAPSIKINTPLSRDMGIYKNVPGYADGGSVIGGVIKAQQFARSMAGKPYIWGGTGPAGMDCSGYMGAITHVLRGQNPFSGRIGVARSQPWPGFRPGLGSAFATGFNQTHTAGTLGGVNVESGSTPIRYPGSQGADGRAFTGHAFLPQVGGVFASGGVGGSGNFIDIGALLDPIIREGRGFLDNFLRPVPPKPWLHDMGLGMYDKGAEGLKSKATELMGALFGGGGGAAAPAQVNGWIMEALRILGWPASYAAGISQQIMTESGGNPNAVQHGYTDVNTRTGNLARGIMQVIPPTFFANALPGHLNIMNPVDNIIAGSRYAMKRYGAGWFSPGPQHSHGYDSGGGLPTGWTMAFNGSGAPEPVLTQSQWDTMYQTAQAARSMVTNNTTNNGLTAADIELLCRRIAELRPLIGSLHQQLPEGASVKDMIDEVTFELRHTQKGMYG